MAHSILHPSLKDLQKQQEQRLLWRDPWKLNSKKFSDIRLPTCLLLI